MCKFQQFGKQNKYVFLILVHGCVNTKRRIRKLFTACDCCTAPSPRQITPIVSHKVLFFSHFFSSWRQRSNLPPSGHNRRTQPLISSRLRPEHNKAPTNPAQRSKNAHLLLPPLPPPKATPTSLGHTPHNTTANPPKSNSSRYPADSPPSRPNPARQPCTPTSLPRIHTPPTPGAPRTPTTEPPAG